jgi:uncharacterized MAPEG superfamily protein
MSSHLSNFINTNISLHTIPPTWCLALIPRMWGRIKYAKAVGHDMDIRNPRDHYNAVASEEALSPELRGRILRAEGAMQNHLDNMGLFAAAVVAGNVAKLSPGMLNGLSLGYLLCRVVYMYVYIRNETRAQAFVRAVTFFSGLGVVFALFHMAGLRLVHLGS